MGGRGSKRIWSKKWSTNYISGMRDGKGFSQKRLCTKSSSESYFSKAAFLMGMQLISSVQWPLSLSMANGRSVAGDASVMLDMYYGHGCHILAWASLPPAQSVNRAEGLGTTQLLLPSSTATATATNPTTTFHLHNAEGRPYESEASLSIH